MLQHANLTNRQKMEKRRIDAKIQFIKAKSRKRYRSKPGEQVKYATARLRQLYCSQSVRNNQDYLLQRYANLEHRESTWSNIWLPMFTPILSISFISGVLKDLFAEFAPLREYIPMISMMTIPDKIYAVLLLSFIVLGVVLLGFSIWKLCELIIYSLMRNADTTIIENEKIILKALLIEHGVLLKEDDELTRIHGSE